MTTKSWVWKISIAATIAASAWAGTVGKVIPIGGMASDLALDENRERADMSRTLQRTVSEVVSHYCRQLRSGGDG